MNTQLTEIAFILDRSGSMQSLKEQAISGFNRFLSQQKESPGEAVLSLVLFDDEYLVPINSQALEEVPELTAATFQPRGCTALLDAIGRTIDKTGKRLANLCEEDRPGQVIIAIFTDGYENASTDYSVEQVRQMIEHQTNTYQWEFLFLAANEEAITTADSYGIQRQNSAAIQFSKVGMSASMDAMSAKINEKRANMASGRPIEDCEETPLNELYDSAEKNQPKD